MKKNNYQTPEVEIFNVASNGKFCDFIPTSEGPGYADVKVEKSDCEELNAWEIDW